MLALADIVQRVRDGMRDLRVVGSAADLGAVREDTRTVPACYLVPVSEAASRNTRDNGLSQRVTATLGVVTVVRNVRDARGEAGRSDLDALRQRLLDLLLGWTPPGAARPMEYVRGRLVTYSDATLWWQDEFAVEFYLRK